MLDLATDQPASADERPGETPGRAARQGPARHVALFIYALTGGGAQRRTLTLANAFAARGHRVDLVVVRTAGVLNGELAPAVRLVGLDRGWGRAHVAIGRLLGQRGAETVLAIPALARYLRRLQPDVLLSAASHVNLAAVTAWRLAAVPVALVLRASNHPSGNLGRYPLVQRPVRAYLRWLARHLYPRADAVIAVSAGVGAEIARLTGLPRARLTTIYNPVVTPALVSRMTTAVEHPWFAPDAPPVVVAAGRLTLQKDFGTLLRAFGQLRATRPARLVILGDGPQRGRLEALIGDLGLGADVLLPGYVDNPLAWMRPAAVFVLSSLWEGLPAVLIEALACGCPVVSTNCPSGPAEILDGGVYGPLVPVGDWQALAGAVAAVLDAPPEAGRLRARAAMFSPEAAIGPYLAVLERCIRRRALARLAWRPPWPLRVALGRASEASLDDHLDRFGLTRGDLFTPFAGNAAHRRLMAEMLARLGIDPHRATARDWAAMKAADTRCAGCTTVSRCRRWLGRPDGDDEPRAFCPNAGLFQDIARAQGGWQVRS